MSFGSMDACAWILLLSILTLVVALFLHRRQSQFRGIGMFGASCPRCAAPLPSVRKTTSIRDSIVGRMDLQQMRLQGRQVRSGERLVIEPRCSLSPPGARKTAIGSAPDRTCRRTAICKRVRSPPYPALTLRLTFLPLVSNRVID
jgi:hypothetical protein